MDHDYRSFHQRIMEEEISAVDFLKNPGAYEVSLYPPRIKKQNGLFPLRDFLKGRDCGPVRSLREFLDSGFSVYLGGEITESPVDGYGAIDLVAIPSEGSYTDYDEFRELRLRAEIPKYSSNLEILKRDSTDSKMISPLEEECLKTKRELNSFSYLEIEDNTFLLGEKPYAVYRYGGASQIVLSPQRTGISEVVFPRSDIHLHFLSLREE